MKTEYNMYMWLLLAGLSLSVLIFCGCMKTPKNMGLSNSDVITNVVVSSGAVQIQLIMNISVAKDAVSGIISISSNTVSVNVSKLQLQIMPKEENNNTYYDNWFKKLGVPLGRVE